MTTPWFIHLFDSSHPMGVVQTSRADHLPEAILRRAHQEYERQGHHQSFERMQERGGFGLVEVVGLLADALEIQPLDGGSET